MSSPGDKLFQVTDLLARVLELLDSVLRRVQLDGTPDALKSLVDTLVGILSSASSHRRLLDLCFQILYTVISKPELGLQRASATEVLRSLTPMILSPVRSPLRVSAIGFVISKVVPLGHENDAVKTALVHLPRFLASKAPEKNEPRTCAVDSIMEIFRVMEEDGQRGFTEFVLKITRGKLQLRLLAVDLILALLTSVLNPRGVKGSFQYLNNNEWAVNCLRALLQRCSDAAPGIRARALTHTAQVLGFLTGDSDICSNLWQFTGIGKVGFNELLRRRCQDDKAAVRKASLLLVTKTTAMIGSPFDQNILRTLSSACSDPLVTIRKAAIVALSEVDAHVKALKTLCKRKATRIEEGDALVLKWAHQLLSKALEILDSYVSEVSESGKVNSFFTPPQNSSQKEKRDASLSKSTIKAVTAAFTIGSLILVCPSADLQGILPVLHSIITSRSSEPKPRKLVGLTFSFKDMAPLLYIQAWVAMGKICLANDKLAKRYIPLFVQELERSDKAALRNNLMMAMTDFCVRYTSLVDCYIHNITVILRDPCEVVRRQTFIFLSQLLQRDYVKWRGVLFLRFLVSLVDESEKIRHMAEFLFGSILKAKAPLLAYNSFIEAIFFLNDCGTHSMHSESEGDLSTRSQLFCIKGTDEKSRSQRMKIYVSLLKQMAPEHLLATSAKLCAEILAAVSDGLLNIQNATGLSVLQDALDILACKEMRIHPSRGCESSEIDDEGGEGVAGGSINAAKGRVVTQVAKKNLIQIAMPIFIELKQLLESKNSPLTGCLMECLRVLLKDYKNEIDEILIADKQLQKELLYDMQKYEAAKAKSTVAEVIANVQRTGSYRSPNGQNSTGIYTKLTEELGTEGKIASAVADAAAIAKVKSMLKEVNRNSLTPPLHSMSVPKLKSKSSAHAGLPICDRPTSVLESLRRRQSFESDDEE